MYTLAHLRPILCKYVAGGVGPTDARVLQRINEAAERFFALTDFRHKKCRYVFKTQLGTFTLPRHLDTALAVDIDGVPHEIRNQWFEFLESGPGELCPKSFAYRNLIDRGDDWATFADITPNTKLKVYADVAEGSGAAITVQGYDNSGNDVWTTDGHGNPIHGEVIALNHNTPQTSVTRWLKITRVIKPLTNGYVRLYQLNDDSTQVCISLLHPDEEVPALRRYMIPGIDYRCPEKVVVLCQRKYLPVRRDNDIVLPASVGGFKNMLLALGKEDAGDLQAARELQAAATALVRADLRQFLGPSAESPIDMQRMAWGGFHGLR